jgi:hypothetical protein
MPRHRRLRLEALEGRWLPATLVWTGAVSDRWDVPGNWDLRHVPTAADVAVIDRAGAVVQILSGAQRVAQLVCTQTLEITGGTLTIAPATNRGRGPGLIGVDLIDAVTTDDALPAPDPSSVANLRMLGGTLNASALEVTASLVWGGGTLKGDTFTVSGHAILNGGNKMLDGVEFRNLGTLTWSSGRVRVGDDSTLVNAPGAMFQVNAADSRFDPKLLNNGMVVVAASGVIEMAGLAQSGVLALRGGTLKVGSFTQTDGVTDLQGGALASGQALLLYGGSLTGSGTVLADVSAVAGRIAPGGGSTLVINGDLTLGNAAGVSAVAVVGGGNDEVVVKGQAVLDGELLVRVVGVPGNAVQYVVLTAGNLTGNFKTVRTFAPGAKVTVTVGGKTVVVEAAPIPVQPDQPADQPGIDDAPSSDPDTRMEDVEEADTTAGPTSLVQFFGGQILSTTPQSSLSYAQSPFRLDVGGGSTDLGGARKTALSHETILAARPEEPLGLNVDSALPLPALPDLALASDDDLLSSAELAASLLLGGRTRARLSSQGGTALSAVATVLSGENLAAPVGPADAALGGLLVDPVGRLGNWPDAAARAEEATPVAALTKTAPAAVLAAAGLLVTARGGKRGKSGSRRASRQRRKDGE